MTRADSPAVTKAVAVESHRHVHEEMVVSSGSSVKTVVRDRSTHVVSRAAGGAAMSGLNAAMRNNQETPPACDRLGTITVRSGTCYKCLNCGGRWVALELSIPPVRVRGGRAIASCERLTA